MNAPLTPEEIQQVSECRSLVAWDAFCDQVKAARGGEYPSDIRSGGYFGGVAAREYQDTRKAVIAHCKKSPAK